VSLRAAPPPAFDSLRPPEAEVIADCVHCGFCLPACPTYRLWGNEADSPRGRIHLMDAALRGELALSPELAGHWDACLGCMACVPACPSGVRYDRLIERTRQQVERRLRRPLGQRLLRSALFAVLPHRRRVRAVAAALMVYRSAGVERQLRRPIVQRHLPESLRTVQRLVPPVTAASLRSVTPRHVAAMGRRRARVVLLEGCVQGAMFSEVNAATARVLAAHGCDVVVPVGQGCCGALELHAGRESAARERALALLALIERDNVDRFVVNAAGCGSAMKAYDDLVAESWGWTRRAARFTPRVRDVMELLAELEADTKPSLHPLPLRVAYHDACHLAHAQGIRLQPREVLRRIPELTLIDVPEGDVCCGSAGVYNLLQPLTAAELGRAKAEAIRGSGADIVATGNPGCVLQIRAWLSAAGAGMPVLHPVQLVDASLRGRHPLDVLEHGQRPSRRGDMP
jgi:glycolate dehydrogenase iron-sulfur subunit